MPTNTTPLEILDMLVTRNTHALNGHIGGMATLVLLLISVATLSGYAIVGRTSSGPIVVNPVQQADARYNAAHSQILKGEITVADCVHAAAHIKTETP